MNGFIGFYELVVVVLSGYVWLSQKTNPVCRLGGVNYPPPPPPPPPPARPIQVAGESATLWQSGSFVRNAKPPESVKAGKTVKCAEETDLL